MLTLGLFCPAYKAHASPFKKENSHGWIGSVVGVLAYAPKGHRFGFWSRVCTWGAGLICGACWRQPIDVSHSQ